MKIQPFQLERYFAQYEFSVQYLLSSSDCDGLAQNELLKLAGPEARRLWDELTLGYTESLGHPLLREEIARLYDTIRPGEVLVLAPEEGIYIALNTILEPGDHVICTFPGYQSLYQVAESLGCDLTRWTPEEEHGWRFDPDFLERHLRPETKLLVINFPHNPTGYLPPREDFERIVQFAKDNRLYLFSDEMYWLLEFDPGDRLPAACDLYENAVTLFGMSKTFGLAGIRIGWLATHNAELCRQMAAFKDYTTICSSAPSEILAIIGLQNQTSIIRRHLERIDRNLRLLDDFFARYAGRFAWVKPKAGTIGFPRLKGEPDAPAFCREAVMKGNIMLLPSSVFGYGDRHIRIGFGRENMPEALSRLEDFLAA